MNRPLVSFEHTPVPAPLWAEAGHDAAAFGAAVDRVFGEASDLHVAEYWAAVDEPVLIVDDPLVLLGNLLDGLGLPMAEVPPAPMPELAAVYDFAPDGFDLHDFWVYDSHA
jgi:hypothetical protein